ncbi:Leucine-zipper-like transcriptional regulator 1 [Perkinsus olseni]|uniref:Leucine-zipper-like transcriptional regulator 1 n=1 Tax=Perkinsus olseni TaxID=32597 RepID=A0A7J6PBX0_PEROL|nr:Leucine-zipper-like transcriptional regulator 1 [Perkinsus olseni]
MVQPVAMKWQLPMGSHEGRPGPTRCTALRLLYFIHTDRALDLTTMDCMQLYDLFREAARYDLDRLASLCHRQIRIRLRPEFVLVILRDCYDSVRRHLPIPSVTISTPSFKSHPCRPAAELRTASS